MSDLRQDGLGRILVEPARLDSPEAWQMIRAMWAELDVRYADLLGDENEPIERAPPDQFVPPEGAFVVARMGGRPVGCGGIRRLDRDAAEVKRMYVAPEARRTGVARTILRALEDRARALGYRVVRLETGVRQPEAMALYASSGYQEIPCYGGYAGDPLSRCFEKGLTPARP